MNDLQSDLTQYDITDDGFETSQSVRKIKSSDPEGRRHMLDSTAAINKLVRYAQMMDQLHVKRVELRKDRIITSTQNHIVIFVAIVRIYHAVGVSGTPKQTFLADRYGMDRGTVKKVLDDFVEHGYLNSKHRPTQLFIETYKDFVEAFCLDPATENFCRSIAYGLMLRAAPDEMEYEKQLKKRVGIST